VAASVAKRIIFALPCDYKTNRLAEILNLGAPEPDITISLIRSARKRIGPLNDRLREWPAIALNASLLYFGAVIVLDLKLGGSFPCSIALRIDRYFTIQ
jgi:hypothetical protein